MGLILFPKMCFMTDMLGAPERSGASPPARWRVVVDVACGECG